MHVIDQETGRELFKLEEKLRATKNNQSNNIKFQNSDNGTKNASGKETQALSDTEGAGNE